MDLLGNYSESDEEAKTSPPESNHPIVEQPPPQANDTQLTPLQTTTIAPLHTGPIIYEEDVGPRFEPTDEYENDDQEEYPELIYEDEEDDKTQILPAQRPFPTELLRQLDAKLPRSMNKKVDPALQQKIDRFLQLKKEQNKNLNQSLVSSHNFHNPYLVDNLIPKFGISSFSSLFSPNFYDPNNFPQEDFLVQINKERDQMEKEKQQSRKERTSISFVSDNIPSSSSSVLPNPLERNSSDKKAPTEQKKTPQNPYLAHKPDPNEKSSQQTKKLSNPYLSQTNNNSNPYLQNSSKGQNFGSKMKRRF